MKRLPEDQRKALFAKQGGSSAGELRPGPLPQAPKAASPACSGSDCAPCKAGNPCRDKRTALALVHKVLNSHLRWGDKASARTAIGSAIMQEAHRQGRDPATAVRVWEAECDASSVLEAMKKLGASRHRREAP